MYIKGKIKETLRIVNKKCFPLDLSEVRYYSSQEKVKERDMYSISFDKGMLLKVIAGLEVFYLQKVDLRFRLASPFFLCFLFKFHGNE